MNKTPAASASEARTGNSSSLPLAGRRILITRPQGQQRELRDAVEAAGGEALSLPLLAIEPVAGKSADSSLRGKLDRLQSFDTLIFVSANAARFGAKSIEDTGAAPAPAARVFAVGSATAREVSLRLACPVQSPATGSGSEALLEMPQLENVAGSQIAIFRGEGGRELLAAELRRRGAQVTYLEVYRRVPAPGVAERLARTLAAGPIDGVIVTSAEALQHWRELTASDGQNVGTLIAESAKETMGQPSQETTLMAASERRGCPNDALIALTLIVPSRRVAEFAAQYGFPTVVNAGDAGAKAMVETLTANLPQRRTEY